MESLTWSLIAISVGIIAGYLWIAWVKHKQYSSIMEEKSVEEKIPVFEREFSTLSANYKYAVHEYRRKQETLKELQQFESLIGKTCGFCWYGSGVLHDKGLRCNICNRDIAYYDLQAEMARADVGIRTPISMYDEKDRVEIIRTLATINQDIHVKLRECWAAGHRYDLAHKI